jgi:hypothetical protein
MIAAGQLVKTARLSAMTMWGHPQHSSPSSVQRIVQADSGSDSDSESRHRAPRHLPAGRDRRVEAGCRRWLQTSRNDGTDN